MSSQDNDQMFQYVRENEVPTMVKADMPCKKRGFFGTYKWHIFFILLLVVLAFYYHDEICDSTAGMMPRRTVSVMNPRDLRSAYDGSIGTPSELRAFFN